MHQFDERGTYMSIVHKCHSITHFPMGHCLSTVVLLFRESEKLISWEQLSKTGVLIFAIADTVAATQTEFSTRTRKFYV